MLSLSMLLLLLLPLLLFPTTCLGAPIELTKMRIDLARILFAPDCSRSTQHEESAVLDSRES